MASMVLVVGSSPTIGVEEPECGFRNHWCGWRRESRGADTALNYKGPMPKAMKPGGSDPKGVVAGGTVPSGVEPDGIVPLAVEPSVVALGVEPRFVVAGGMVLMGAGLLRLVMTGITLIWVNPCICFIGFY